MTVSSFYYDETIPITSNLYTTGTQAVYSINALPGTVLTEGELTFGSDTVAGKITLEKGKIHPVLAFKYIKKKFGKLEKVTMDRRLEKLSLAFDKAMENGQYAFGEKILKEFSRETRESAIYAKGIKHFVERADVMKVKNKIKGGRISDTQLKDYTRIIPEKILEKKKNLENVFDGFVIYHYWDDVAEKKRETSQKMTADEKQKMKDPILFGWIKETDRLYFIKDWEDEYCDLTFDEMIGVVADRKLTKYPVIEA